MDSLRQLTSVEWIGLSGIIYVELRELCKFCPQLLSCARSNIDGPNICQPSLAPNVFISFWNHSLPSLLDLCIKLKKYTLPSIVELGKIKYSWANSCGGVATSLAVHYHSASMLHIEQDLLFSNKIHNILIHVYVHIVEIKRVLLDLFRSCKGTYKSA